LHADRHASRIAPGFAALLLVCASLRCEQAPALHAADVPVHAPFAKDPDPVTTCPESFPMQVAVLWTRPDEHPLGVIHALRGMGVPFFVTRDFDQALRHRLVILFPGADKHTFTADQVKRLTRHVSDGGALFAQNVLADALRDLFGFQEARRSLTRHRISFTGGADPILRYLNRPEEREVRLASAHYKETLWSSGYQSDPAAVVLASYDDGSAALLARPLGRGRAYLCGPSLTNLVLRCQSNRDFEAERHYVNVFEPGADVWLLLLRAWYESSTPDAIRLVTVPDGRRSTLLLTHDVDWENSFAPAADFARLEKEAHASSTFFIQTKYLSDANSMSFFQGANLDRLRDLAAQGFSIGSHSIMHARGFNAFDLGPGSETFATYRPRALSADKAEGATVFGEVRVSKSLLDGEIPGQRTILFRAGHLRVPRTLPEALERCGYEFDSSFTACDVLSNFPYHLPRDLGFEDDSGVYEFPVTIEDEETPGIAARVPEALEVIRANADNGAVNVLLIHTNDAKGKLQAESSLLKALPDDVGVGDLLSFARFWRARDRLLWRVTPEPSPGTGAGGATRVLRLEVTADEPVSGLTFEFARPVASITGGATLLPDRRHAVLPDLRPRQRITLRVQLAAR
jgi:hypothetical protein